MKFFSEIHTLKDDVARANTNCSEEVKSKKIEEELETIKEEVGESYYLSNNGCLKVSSNLWVGVEFELKMKVKPEKLTGILAAIHKNGLEFLHLQINNGSLILNPNC